MKAPASLQKLRGGYYTPSPIAEFLCSWAIQDSNAEVLEPSCGDGEFLRAAAERLLSLGAAPLEVGARIIGVEVARDEAHKASARLKGLGIEEPSVHNDDFFAYSKNNLMARLFDAVVGNPPFIRYQHFLEDHRRNAFELMSRVGMRPNRLTNAWTPFVVASTVLLREGGRLAMVIPAELLQVGYAAELRNFLNRTFKKLTIFTFRKLVFGGIQQEVVLLCGERGRLDAEDAWIRTVELNDLPGVVSHEHTEFEQTELKTMDHASEKWTQYFLSQQELELVRRMRVHPKLTKLGDVASVDVGIVTGMNDFFVLTRTQARQRGLSPYTGRLATRSAQLKGIVFRSRDWKTHFESDGPVLLLDLPKRRIETLGRQARKYVTYGEEQGVHEGYKCSIRDPWYCIPSVWNPDGFLLRQIHGYPKLVLNRARAACTDTIHRVRFKDVRDARKIAAAFLNSMTFAFAELLGRSYGGGVLELEPNEADALPLPLARAECLSIEEADRWLRREEDVEGILDRHDSTLLEDGLGMTKSEVRVLRDIWMKLRDRRIERKKGR
jgi:adenine-specific DNA methylase